MACETMLVYLSLKFFSRGYFILNMVLLKLSKLTYGLFELLHPMWIQGNLKVELFHLWKKKNQRFVQLSHLMFFCKKKKKKAYNLLKQVSLRRICVIFVKIFEFSSLQKSSKPNFQFKHPHTWHSFYRLKKIVYLVQIHIWVWKGS